MWYGLDVGSKRRGLPCDPKERDRRSRGSASDVEELRRSLTSSLASGHSSHSVFDLIGRRKDELAQSTKSNRSGKSGRSVKSVEFDLLSTQETAQVSNTLDQMRAKLRGVTSWLGKEKEKQAVAKLREMSPLGRAISPTKSPKNEANEPGALVEKNTFLHFNNSTLDDRTHPRRRSMSDVTDRSPSPAEPELEPGCHGDASRIFGAGKQKLLEDLQAVGRTSSFASTDVCMTGFHEDIDTDDEYLCPAPESITVRRSSIAFPGYPGYREPSPSPAVSQMGQQVTWQPVLLPVNQSPMGSMPVSPQQLSPVESPKQAPTLNLSKEMPFPWNGQPESPPCAQPFPWNSAQSPIFADKAQPTPWAPPQTPMQLQQSVVAMQLQQQGLQVTFPSPQGNMVTGLAPQLNAQGDMMMVPAFISVPIKDLIQPQPARPDPVDFSGRSELTFMIRNVPNKYRPEMLLEAIQDFRAGIDFYYMPIDFKNHGNLGYAFVNFHDVDTAKKFQLHFNGFRLPMYQQSNKVLAVSEARVQGLTANVERFRNSSVMGVLNEEHKPMVFDKDGTQKEFPKPDGQLPAAGPRFRRPR